jgi:RHS repeat-associated protein
MISSLNGVTVEAKNGEVERSFSMLFDIYPYYDHDTKELAVLWDEEIGTMFEVFLRYDNSDQFVKEADLLSEYRYVIDEKKFRDSFDIRIVAKHEDGTELTSVIKSMVRSTGEYTKSVIDNDNDYIPDGYEIWDLETDILSSDSDGDGISDSIEVFLINSNPNKKNKKNLDSDKDGVTDLEELKFGTSLISNDTDTDGISDKEEIEIYKSNPVNPDTNGNGLVDYVDLSVNYKGDFEFVIISSPYDIIVKDDKNELIEEYVYNVITQDMKSVKYSSGVLVNYLYDNKGNLNCIVKNSNGDIDVTSYVYKDNDVASINANKTIYSFEYSDDSKLKEVKVGKNKYASFDYIGEDYVSVQLGNGQKTEYKYKNGKVEKKWKDGNLVGEWKYNMDDSLDSFIDYSTNLNVGYEYVDGEISNVERINEHNELSSFDMKVIDDGWVMSYDVNDVLTEHRVSIDERTGDWTSTINNNLQIVFENGTKDNPTRTIYNKNNSILNCQYSVENDKISSFVVNGDIYEYEYNELGKIENIMLNGVKHESYYYDDRGQLVRADSKENNLTQVIVYDTNGNILEKKSTAYTEGDPQFFTDVDAYTYNNEYWKDMLTNYNGIDIKYDEIGNPLNYVNGEKLKWDGKELKSIISEDKILEFDYDVNGLRSTKRTDDGETQYIYNGNNLIQEVKDGNYINYYYDNSNSLTGFSYENQVYVYKKNIQNDVIGIIDENGVEVVKYAYDAWGKLLKTEGKLADSIGIVNPFLYKSYYYDHESSMYYLLSRYYSPDTSRFLNADSVFDVHQGVINHNLFKYCENDPINNIDSTGMWVVSLGFEANAAVVFGIFTSVQVSMDNNLNGNVSWTLGGWVITNFGASISAFICFYPTFTNVSQVQGWAFTVGASWSAGVYVAVGGSFNIASNSIYGSGCLSFGVGTYVTGIPSLQVKAGYTSILFNFHIPTVINNWYTGQYHKQTSQGVDTFLKKAGSYYVDIYSSNQDAKIRIYLSGDIKVIN